MRSLLIGGIAAALLATVGCSEEGTSEVAEVPQDAAAHAEMPMEEAAPEAVVPEADVAEAEVSEAEAALLEEIEGGNHAYAGRERAILKIDDTAYLDEGQMGWLVRHEDDRVHYLWTLEEPAEFVLSLSYDGETGMLTHGDTNMDMFAYHEADNDSYVVNDMIQMTAFTTQMRPGEMGLRATVYNQNNPAADHFEGLLWYDYNLDLVIEARFEPMDEFVPETFQTSRGWYKEFQHVGHAVFSLGGEELRMPLYGFTTDPAEIDGVSAFFTDAMAGVETYGVGRYLDITMEAGSFPPETVTVDFNYAYNPNCARSEYYNCPYAEYDIPVAVRAGEMKPADH